MSRGDSHNIFEVKIESRYYFVKEKKPKNKMMIYNGEIKGDRTGKRKKFHGVADFLKKLEDMYFEEEKEKRKK